MTTEKLTALGELPLLQTLKLYKRWAHSTPGQPATIDPQSVKGFTRLQHLSLNFHSADEIARILASAAVPVEIQELQVNTWGEVCFEAIIRAIPLFCSTESLKVLSFDTSVTEARMKSASERMELEFPMNSLHHLFSFKNLEALSIFDKTEFFQFGTVASDQGIEAIGMAWPRLQRLRIPGGTHGARITAEGFWRMLNLCALLKVVQVAVDFSGLHRPDIQAEKESASNSSLVELLLDDSSLVPDPDALAAHLVQKAPRLTRVAITDTQASEVLPDETIHTFHDRFSYWKEQQKSP